MNRKRLVVAGALICLAILTIALLGIFVWQHFPPLRAANSEFLVEPYLQIGRSGKVRQPELVWASYSTDDSWSVEISNDKLAPLAKSPAVAISHQSIHIANMPDFQLFHAQLPELPPAATASYAVRHHGQTVYTSDIQPIEHASKVWTAAIAGDLASGNEDELHIARSINEAGPDLVVIPGDVVYNYGRTLEYLDHFFPVYNGEKLTDPGGDAWHHPYSGVPLMRRVIFAAAPGNHDTANGARHDTRDLAMFPDALSYFVWWRFPLNGPDVHATKGEAPVPYGPSNVIADFKNDAGDNYPREENYSFDFQNSHWTILDANSYMDWSKPELQQWLRKDLQTDKTWKFVVYHQTAFSSDKAHFNDQQMRLISQILQENGVNIVFAGHVHNYQRTYPLKFFADSNSRQPDGTVPGKLELDKNFDGSRQTNATAPIYITTGGGGADLYGGTLPEQPGLWQPYTCKFISRHSFTRMDVGENRLHVKQIADDGSAVDEFTVTKGSV